jgi:hypothetical protein
MISDQGLGEEGVLEDLCLRTDLRPNLISVVANHSGEIRKGVILLEDPVHLRILYGSLRQHLGRSLTEIGDLEISLPPPLAKRGPHQVRPSAPLPPKTAAK